MSKKFLFSSAVLFIGGTLLAFFGFLVSSDFFSILSILLLLMGGIPLLCVWFKELFQLLPEETKDTKSNEK